jgi:hypothetical protein
VASPLGGALVGVPSSGGFRVNWEATTTVCLWPILLKNSIRGFLRVNLEVSNHHLINLRGTERILEGRLFRGL